jgi:prefoldin subunit 5
VQLLLDEIKHRDKCTSGVSLEEAREEARERLEKRMERLEKRRERLEKKGAARPN